MSRTQGGICARLSGDDRIDFCGHCHRATGPDLCAYLARHKEKEIMFPLAAIKGLLFSRTVLFAVALFVSLLVGYNWAYSRGKESQAPIIAELTSDLSDARLQVSVARDNAIAQGEAYTRAVGILENSNKATLKDLKTKLDQSEAFTKKLQESFRVVIPQYITPQADAICSISAGFVRFHNLSAEGRDTGPATEGGAAAGSGPKDADTPTTLKISEVGAVISENYSECNNRREVIEAWQTWYTKAKASIDRANQEQLNWQRTRTTKGE